MEKKQIIQDEQYSEFPYHYLPHMKNGVFRQHRNLFWGYEYYSYTKHVIDEITRLKPKSYCDIGCGEGKMLVDARDYLPGTKLVGVEYSQTPLLYAHAFSQGKNITFLEQDVYTADVKQEYDVVTLIEVVEHIPPQDLSRFIEACLRYVKKDGHLIITTPCDNLPVQQKHYQHFSFKSLESHFTGNAEVVSREYLNVRNWKTRFVQKILGNSLFILNNNRLLRKIYSYYRKNCLIANENNAGRVKLTVKKIS